MNFPSDQAQLFIEVFYLKDDAPFVCGVSGRICIDNLIKIENELTEYDFELGDGSYLFATNYVPAETDGPHTICPAYWDLTLVEFRPIHQKRMMMETTINSYLVRTPIYGYNGMGYDHARFLEKEFDSLQKAQKWARKCDRVFNGDGAKTSLWEAFYREMTDNISYSIKGLSKIYEKTVIMKELNDN
jgi:hypothetical protein